MYFNSTYFKLYLNLRGHGTKTYSSEKKNETTVADNNNKNKQTKTKPVTCRQERSQGEKVKMKAHRAHLPICSCQIHDSFSFCALCTSCLWRKQK